MALRAGYYGVKRWLWDKLQIVPELIDWLINNNNKTGAKNKLRITAATTTVTDVTFMVNADGSVTLNSSGAIAANRDLNLSTTLYLNKDDVVKMSFAESDTDKVRITIYNNTTTSQVANGWGKDVEYKAQSTGNYTVYIRAISGKSFSDFTIYPMIRDAADPDPTFEPFAMTNRQLTNAYNIVDKTGVTYDSTYCDAAGSSASLSVKGNLAQIIGVVKITTQIPQYTKFIEGLPPVKSSGGAAFNFALLSSADGTKTYRCYLDTYGKISAHVTPIPVGSYVLSFVYFCTEDSGVLTRSLDAAPDERSLDVEVEEPVVIKKTTRKKTTKTEEEE